MAEVLLRKTRATDVVPVWTQIIRRYPEVADMAAASPHELRRLIQPLGLPSRAETLISAAKWIVAENDGRVPSTPSSLRQFKGIGTYTANAVVCVAFDKPFAMVDESVGRTVRRVLGIRSAAPASSDKALVQWVQAAVPSNSAREFGLTLLRLSKEVCRLKEPDCGQCPLAEICAFASASSGEGCGSATTLPKPMVTTEASVIRLRRGLSAS